ncbi:hypothetical protein AMEX_G7290, partial [Astyanax mexicanus]
HMPNVAVYDFARGLATHGNLRQPEDLPFTPHEGRLLQPTEENIRLAKDKKISVSLPWLVEKKMPSDVNGHPVTGSSKHYVIYDTLHESNTKDEKDFLRRLNSQVVEQFFSRMERNNYYLNMMSPASQVFLIRSIIHHGNVKLNEARLEKVKKGLGLENISFDRYGRATIGDVPEPFLAYSIGTTAQMEDAVTAPTSVAADDMDISRCEVVTQLEHIHANREIWNQTLTTEQIRLLDRVLDTQKSNEENIVQIYKCTLKRSDFLTLGLSMELEATIANCCLQLVTEIARHRGIDAYTVDPYVVVTWKPPYNQDPFLSLPPDAGSKDVILLPSWQPGHWVLCVSCSKFGAHAFIL